jgi:hypothetical protein
MTDWRKRLTDGLEPILRAPDPRPRISAYHDMPYAIFHYPPEVEWAIRGELELLKTRLEQAAGKRVLSISLADCLSDALHAEGLDVDTLAEIEANVGLAPTLETIHEVLGDRQPLDQLVAQRIPGDADPLRDILFIVRAGALFPVYRTSSLLEQLQGKVRIPAVLFYPGDLDGTAGLRFMGVLEAEHNYRPRIF